MRTVPALVHVLVLAPVLSVGVTIGFASLATEAHAQPAGPDKPGAGGDKGDAKALMSSGLKLFAAKDYLGALSVFQTAYVRFPSAKILLNIGTTLVKLDRKAEAANAYQGYLDSPDVEPAKKVEVVKVLAGLDVEVGVVELTVTPADAEVQLGTGEWIAPAQHARARVPPGSFTVRARKPGWKPAEQTSSVAAGGQRSLTLTLDAEPVAANPDAGGATLTTGPTSIRTVVEPERPPSKLGLLAIAHVDPQNKGGAVLVGVAFDVASRITLQAAALLGPVSGGYAGVTVALLTGRVRPILVAGLPIFVASGARVSSRAAAGVEIAFNRHLAVVAEVGVEHVFNPEPNVVHTMFVPAVGVIGRL